jgi:hypothetical protein
MKVQMLAEAVSNAAVAAQSSVDLDNKTPFLPGRKVEAFIERSPDATASGTIVIQGSDDDSTWTTVLTSSALAGKRAMVDAYRYMRANMTVAGTAGTYNAGIRA